MGCSPRPSAQSRGGGRRKSHAVCHNRVVVQTKSSKHQRKLQTTKLQRSSVAGCCLMPGASLELGTWNLEFRSSLAGSASLRMTGVMTHNVVLDYDDVRQALEIEDCRARVHLAAARRYREIRVERTDARCAHRQRDGNRDGGPAPRGPFPATRCLCEHLDFIDRQRFLLLPNTSGARNAAEAVRLARLAVAAPVMPNW